MRALYSCEQIREIEKKAPSELMPLAGAAAANTALALLKNLAKNSPLLVLAGPGNNGGDAFELAAHAAQAGWPVSLCIMGDQAGYSPEAQRALHRVLQCVQTAGLQIIPDNEAIARTDWALVVDGLFGIGLQRPVGGALREMVEHVNSLSCPRLALDVPSGLAADTGCIVGPDGVAVNASHTITFIGDKVGLHTADGRDLAGIISVASLDIDRALFPPAQAWLNDTSLFAEHLQPRRQNTHKGSFGNVAVIGGAHGMSGAAILAARAAARTGAGKVWIGFLDEVPLFDSQQPELMCRQASSLELFGTSSITNSSTCIIAGPGMGKTQAAQELLARILQQNSALVLDADALNLIAAQPTLQDAVRARAQAGFSTLITPHPLEAARCLGTSAAMVQQDRLSAARRLAKQLQVVVVLKGAGTIIARADGSCVINTTGNPALASGGSGDVLAGVCGALLAQGWPVWQAALAAVWLHGRAADVLVERGVGPIGLGANELSPVIREVLNQLIQSAAGQPRS